MNKIVDISRHDRVEAEALAGITAGLAGAVRREVSPANAPAPADQGQALGLREHETPPSDPSERWYCLQHEPFEGAAVRDALRGHRFGCHWPRYVHRARGRDETLVPVFHGYLFVRFDLAKPGWARIGKLDKVVRLVGVRERGAPMPVAPGYVEHWIQASRGPDGVIDPHETAPPAPEIVPGEFVEITTGLLSGLRGLFQAEAGRKRVKLLLEGVMGMPQAIEIPRAHIRVAAL